MVATALTFVRVVLWSVGVEEPGCPTTGGQLGGLRIVLGVGTVAPFGYTDKPAEKHCWLISCERKILF
jgi:hypothetical protein